MFQDVTTRNFITICDWLTNYYIIWIYVLDDKEFPPLYIIKQPSDTTSSLHTGACSTNKPKIKTREKERETNPDIGRSTKQR